jgi:hypothetical protein
MNVLRERATAILDQDWPHGTGCWADIYDDELESLRWSESEEDPATHW